jgi:DNA-binding NarL/FixJ family response regulator
VATVLFLSSDLMFSSRVVGAAKTLGAALQLVANPASLPQKIAADCQLVLIDLSLDNLNLPSAVKAIKASSPAARIIAYGAHVDETALAHAADAGCDLVLTRNQFNKQYADLLRSVSAGS